MERAGELANLQNERREEPNSQLQQSQRQSTEQIQTHLDGSQFCAAGRGGAHLYPRASLVYRESSRSTKATQWDPVSVMTTKWPWGLAWAGITTMESLTSSLKYETPSPSYPAHVFKPQQSDVHTKLGTTLPNSTNIIWAYSRNQGHWRREAYYWEKHRAQQNVWARNLGVLTLVNGAEWLVRSWLVKHNGTSPFTLVKELILKTRNGSWVRWSLPPLIALKRLRQEFHFEASLGHTASLRLARTT